MSCDIAVCLVFDLSPRGRHDRCNLMPSLYLQEIDILKAFNTHVEVSEAIYKLMRSYMCNNLGKMIFNIYKFRFKYGLKMVSKELTVNAWFSKNLCGVINKYHN